MHRFIRGAWMRCQTLPETHCWANSSKFSSPASFLAVDGSCRKLQLGRAGSQGADRWLSYDDFSSCRLSDSPRSLAACMGFSKGWQQIEAGLLMLLPTSAIWSTHLRDPTAPGQRHSSAPKSGSAPDTASLFSALGLEPGQHLWGCYFGWFQIN